jgi:methyltransferase (TIGR00027 family)
MRPHTASHTAELAAMTRASARLCLEAAAIMDDPYAHWFAGPGVAFPYVLHRWVLGCRSFAQWSRGVLAVGFMFPVCRHRFVSDFLRAGIDDGCRQIVMLGAGYDTFALRHRQLLASVRVWEVDHPATQARKLRILRHHGQAGASRVTYVPFDLRDAGITDVLARRGLDSRTPVAVVAEGLFSYLERGQVGGIFAEFGRQRGPLRLAADCRSPSVNAAGAVTLVGRWRGRFRRMGEAYRSFYTAEDIRQQAAAAGWGVCTTKGLADNWRRYAPRLAVPAPLEDAGWLVTAEKR